MSFLKKENVALKAEIELTQKRLEASERVLQMRKEQDMQLRESIVQASKEVNLFLVAIHPRHDVLFQAQRAMGASFVGQRGQIAPDFASVNLNVPASALPIPGIHTAREGQYMRKVKELEEELRSLRNENEKNVRVLHVSKNLPLFIFSMLQKAMIVKFRERWEKLKESAKRKKESKAAAEAAQAVRERIVEEPETEDELDRGGAR